jgi:glycosyltransferase involved in cell wall biosynthesis
MNPPKFSIITVVYNGASLIEGTMQSVLNQTFTDFEYLIIDGRSKDETVMIAERLISHHPHKSFAENRIHLFSEPDKGLYDAMNKGLNRATGEFVLFLNCGDHLFEATTLEKIAAAATPTTDILFGETMLVDEARTHLGTRSEMTVQKLPIRLTWQSMRFGMVVCHQSFLPSRRLTPPYIEGNLAADIDWVIACLKKAQEPTPTQAILSEFLVGGLSKQRHRESLKHRYQVLRKHFGFLPNLLNHVYILVRAVLWKIGRGYLKSY